MKRWLLTIEAQDCPGIVASVTSALADAGCNLADVSMTRLSGVFVLLAVVTAPDVLVPHNIWNAGEFGGVAGWREITDAQATPQTVEGARWNVTVYGSDQPGIVAGIANELAGAGVNIDDLSTRLVGDAYTMLIEATVPAAVEVEVLRRRLSSVAHELGVTCHANVVDVEQF